jgi:hypothetical protein
VVTQTLQVWPVEDGGAGGLVALHQHVLQGEQARPGDQKALAIVKVDNTTEIALKIDQEIKLEIRRVSKRWNQILQESNKGLWAKSCRQDEKEETKSVLQFGVRLLRSPINAVHNLEDESQQGT